MRARGRRATISPRRLATAPKASHTRIPPLPVLRRADRETTAVARAIPTAVACCAIRGARARGVHRRAGKLGRSRAARGLARRSRFLFLFRSRSRFHSRVLFRSRCRVRFLCGLSRSSFPFRIPPLPLRPSEAPAMRTTHVLSRSAIVSFRAPSDASSAGRPAGSFTLDFPCRVRARVRFACSRARPMSRRDGKRLASLARTTTRLTLPPRPTKPRRRPPLHARACRSTSLAVSVPRKARFHHPVGVAITPRGTVIVCDQSNHAVREIAPRVRPVGARSVGSDAHVRTLFKNPPRSTPPEVRAAAVARCGSFLVSTRPSRASSDGEVITIVTATA